jgi:phosphoribosylaminoimidazole-succinocarboxamide synthase
MIQNRLRRFSGTGQMLAATLVETRIRCSRPTCRLCEEGRGHPTRFITFSRKGRTVTVYVPRDDLEEVRGWVREHKRVRRLVREISELSVELLRAEAVIRRRTKGSGKRRRRR